MNPLAVFLLLAGGAWLLLSAKKPTSTSTSAKIPTPVGPVVLTNTPSLPQSASPGTTIQVQTKGDLSPTLTEAEQFALKNYSDDQLYNEALSSNHLAYVAAVGTKLASDGDTRAGDLTLRVANWGT